MTIYNKDKTKTFVMKNEKKRKINNNNPNRDL